MVMQQQLDINVEGSTVNSENDYAIRLVELANDKKAAKFTVNFKHDSSSTLHGKTEYKLFSLQPQTQVIVTENGTNQ